MIRLRGLWGWIGQGGVGNRGLDAERQSTSGGSDEGVIGGRLVGQVQQRAPLVSAPGAPSAQTRGRDGRLVGKWGQHLLEEGSECPDIVSRVVAVQFGFGEPAQERSPVGGDQDVIGGDAAVSDT